MDNFNPNGDIDIWATDRDIHVHCRHLFNIYPRMTSIFELTAWKQCATHRPNVGMVCKSNLKNPPEHPGCGWWGGDATHSVTERPWRMNVNTWMDMTQHCSISAARVRAPRHRAFSQTLTCYPHIITST